MKNINLKYEQTKLCLEDGEGGKSPLQGHDGRRPRKEHFLSKFKIDIP